MLLNHPSHHPIHNVPDADAKGQHDSWPAQGRLSEFPGIDADCENAGYDADDFGEPVIRFILSEGPIIDPVNMNHELKWINLHPLRYPQTTTPGI